MIRRVVPILLDMHKEGSLSFSFSLSVDAGKNPKKKKKGPQKASLMDQISSNKQGVRKQIRQLQANSRTPKSKATVKDKKIKNALGERGIMSETCFWRTNYSVFV